MENTFLKILGNELSHFKLVPSESFYYDKFAYKLKLDAPKVNRYQLYAQPQGEVVDFLYEMHQLLKNSAGEFRRRYDSLGGKYTLYVSEYDDLIHISQALLGRVISVHGPINKQHLKKLQSKQALSVKKSLYFDKHTHKIEMWHTFMDMRALGMNRDSNKELIQFLIDQKPTAKLRGSYWGHVTMYTNKKTFDQLRPFIIMMFPKLKFKETERFIWPQD